jgi:predicted N-acetyltransferase YhbS
MIIRAENTGDELLIRDINIRAFGRFTETNIVDQLRKKGKRVAKYRPEFAESV